MQESDVHVTLKSGEDQTVRFIFHARGLPRGHSPTDYDPGMAEKLAASMSESAPSRSQVLELVRLLPSERAPRGGEAALRDPSLAVLGLRMGQ